MRNGWAIQYLYFNVRQWVSQSVRDISSYMPGPFGPGKKGEHQNYSELKTQLYLIPVGGLNKKEMLNVFSAWTENLEISETIQV